MFICKRTSDWGLSNKTGPEEDTSNVGRTLGHQGPNLWLRVKAGHCPGSRLGCWTKSPALDPGGKTKAEPQTYDSGQSQHRKRSGQRFQGAWA